MNRMKDVPVTPDIKRPPQHLVEGLRNIGTATVASTLFHLSGIQNSHMVGPVSQTPGTCIAGPALTLQFMPIRADRCANIEYNEPEKQLHRHVMYHTQPGDIIVVDARADMKAGVFGEMMMTYFQGRGGAGVIIDGCLRDWGHIRSLDTPCWTRGSTPNFHSQVNLMPYAVNVPIACGECYVEPGDIIVADDDGAVVVPVEVAEAVIERAKQRHGWEDFARERLAQGGDLRVYYPLTDEARPEYDAWEAARGKTPK